MADASPPLDPATLSAGEVLHRGPRSLLRAAVGADGRRLVLKAIAPGVTEHRARQRLRHEHEMLRRAQGPGVVGLHGLVNTALGPTLLLDAVDGEPLRARLGAGPWAVAEALDLAVRVTGALQGLHGRGVFHFDLTPDHVLLGRADGAVTLVDFSRASAVPLPATEVAGREPEALAWLAPEQTGRLDRPADARADLYAVGVLLYRLLAGSLPLWSDDPLALVHAVVAHAPPPLAALRPEAPEVLCAIAHRLLAKSPDERFQSAAGLAHDLRACQDALRRTGAVAPFPVGQADRAGSLHVPATLYGREDDLRALIDAVERVCAGEASSVAVLGAPGVGKTSVVKELRPWARARGGLFAWGKFDPMRRAESFGALRAALDGALRQLLARGDREVERWRHRLTRVLEGSADVLLGLVPALDALLPPPAPGRALPAGEALARQLVAITELLRALHRPDSPLVLALDDMQWVDAGTLDLVEAILRAPDPRNPVLILMWREREASHPLEAMLARLGDAGPARIHLAPLRAEHVERMLANALRMPPDDVRPLAARVTARTEGNPFDIREVLAALAADGALAFDGAAGRWTWSLDAVDRVAPGSGVLELLARRIDALPPAAAQLLAQVACFGRSVEVRVLAAALGRAPREVIEEAVALVARGLLIAVGAGWEVASGVGAGSPEESEAPEGLGLQFPHDRVQEAARRRLTEGERAALHHALARRLAESPVARDERGQSLVAEQLVLGLAAVTSPAERDDAAARLGAAALASRQRGAFGPALTFAEAALTLLDARAAPVADLFALRLAAAESAMALGDRARAEAHVHAGEPVAPDTLARVALDRVRIRGHLARGEHEAAVDLSCASLDRLGQGTPRHPRGHHLAAATAQALWHMRGATRESLARLPECGDAHVAASLSLMTEALLSAYLCEPNLTALWTLELVSRTMRHGVTPQGAYAIACYAFLRAAVFDDVAGGERFSAAAYDLIARLGAKEMLAKVEVMAVGFVQSRVQPLRAVLDVWPRVARHGIEAGDMAHAAQATTNQCSVALACGVEVDELERYAQESLALSRRVGQERSVQWARLFLQVADNLRGRCPDPLTLSGEHVDGAAWVEANRAIGDKAAEVVFDFHLGQLRVWLGDAGRALEPLAAAERGLAAIPGTHQVPILLGYAALARVARAREARAAGRRWEAARLLAAARRNLARLTAWMRPQAASFAPLRHLVAAELAEVDDRWREATAGYDAAVAAAVASDHGIERALALELAGAAWLRRGHGRAAASYLQEARAAWVQHGVTARVERFDEALRRTEVAGALGAGRRSTLPPPPTAGLDATAIARAARALSGEIRVEALLIQLLRLAVQTAGATQGALLLVREDGMRVATLARDGAGGLDVRSLATEASPDGEDPEAVLGPLAAVTAYVRRTRESLLLEAASTDPRFADAFGEGYAGAVLAAPLVRAGELVGIVALEHGAMSGAFNAQRLEMVEALAAQAAVSLVNARLYESLQTALDDQRRLTRAYQRFLPVEFLAQLGKESVLDVSVGDQVQGEVSALFADIRGFTTLAERLGPRETFAFVNRYLAAMEPAIYGHRGHVAQYLGDGIMAVFPGTADDAVEGALAMFAALEAFNAERAADGGAPVRIGVGINTGAVMVGVIGGRSRLDRGLVGDPVNVASRVEGLCKGYGTSLLISGDTRARLADPSRYAMRFLDRVAASGKQLGTDVYEVLDAVPAPQRASRLAAREAYEGGVSLWLAERPAEARRRFEEALALAPDDGAARLFVERCAEAERVGMRLGPGKTSRLDWK